MSRQQTPAAEVCEWVVMEFGKVWGFVDCRIRIAFVRATVLKFIVANSLTLTAEQIDQIDAATRGLLASKQYVIED